MRDKDRGRVLFRESYNPQLWPGLAGIPLSLIIPGIITSSQHLGLGGWFVLAGLLAGVFEYLLIPQRLIVTTVGIQPQIMRLKAILKASSFVPWSAVTALWPLYWCSPLSGETELRGVGFATPELGTAKLIPARSLTGRAKAEHLERAVKEGVGTRLEKLWRGIPDISDNDIERMRRVLMTSDAKESVAGLAQVYVPAFGIVEIQSIYVMLNKRLFTADELCSLLLLVTVLTGVLFIITMVNSYRMAKRMRSHSDMLGLYFQVRLHEERTARKVLPQMQMLPEYRKFDPNPPQAETWRGPELLKSLRRLVAKVYIALGMSIAIPFAVLELVFAYDLSPILLLLSFPLIPAMALLAVSNLFESRNVTAELRIIVHEEWKTGKRYLPEKADLRVWGIQRDPVALMQKNLPRLRAVASKSKREDALIVSAILAILTAIIITMFVLRGSFRVLVLLLSVPVIVVTVALLMRRRIVTPELDPALRAIVEYEKVTGRRLLPPELDSLKKR